MVGPCHTLIWALASDNYLLEISHFKLFVFRSKREKITTNSENCQSNMVDTSLKGQYCHNQSRLSTWHGIDVLV